MDTRTVGADAEMELMLELTRALVAVATRSLDAVGGKVTLSQFRALYVLQHTAPCNAGSLAEHLGSHPSTVTRLCDRLVALGYATRVVRADNRREVELDVTPAGRRIVRAVMRRREAELGHMLAPLAPAVREHLQQALPALVAAARDQHGELPEGWAG